MEHMKPLDRNKLGQLILKLRRSRDLSLDGMGELLHVSGRTIRRWEKGEIIPTMDDIINICNEFDISLEEVFEGEIQIDKEVNRKLSKVDTSIENINDRITTTEKTVNNINSGIISLKEHIDKTYNTSGVDNNDLSWLWLLLIHLICTSLGFISYGMARFGPIKTFIASVIYVNLVSYIIYKNRNDNRNLKILLFYSILLVINMLINYVLFIDITPDIIANTELLVINGAMYGFVILDYPNMQLFLGLCVTVYIIWSVYCVYHLVKNKEKGNR